MSAEKRATLYRMDTPELTCAFGLKARDLLKSRGYSIDEHVLTSRTEVDAFKRSYGVATTPQTFIDGERIGGFDYLHEFFRSHDGA